MQNFRYVTDNEIAVDNLADAITIQEVLLKQDYVVMISKEEQLYIINYIWSSHNADRNDVCFQDREIVEEFIFEN